RKIPLAAGFYRRVPKSITVKICPNQGQSRSRKDREGRLSRVVGEEELVASSPQPVRRAEENMHAADAGARWSDFSRHPHGKVRDSIPIEIASGESGSQLVVVSRAAH